MGPINEGAFFDFTATGSELKPALTYPVGSSPKVFNKGWVFGASFSITDDEGNEVDLSDKVEWSGTATFNPAKGKTSHPSFNIIGSNKIPKKANGKNHENIERRVLQSATKQGTRFLGEAWAIVCVDNADMEITPGAI